MESIPQNVMDYFVDRLLKGLSPEEQKELVDAIEKVPGVVVSRIVPRMSELIMGATAYFKKSVRVTTHQEAAEQIVAAMKVRYNI